MPIYSNENPPSVNYKPPPIITYASPFPGNPSQQAMARLKASAEAQTAMNKKHGGRRLFRRRRSLLRGGDPDDPPADNIVVPQSFTGVHIAGPQNGNTASKNGNIALITGRAQAQYDSLVTPPASITPNGDKGGGENGDDTNGGDEGGGENGNTQSGGRRRRKRRNTRRRRRKKKAKRSRRRKQRRKYRKTRQKRGGAPRLRHELATPAELNERGITWADGTHADVYIAPRDITSDGKHKVVSVGFALAVEKKLSDLAAAINDCHPVGCRKRDKEATAIQAVHRGSMLRKHPPEVLKIHQQFKPGGSGMVEASSRWDNTIGQKRKRSQTGGRKTRQTRRRKRGGFDCPKCNRCPKNRYKCNPEPEFVYGQPVFTRKTFTGGLKQRHRRKRRKRKKRHSRRKSRRYRGRRGGCPLCFMG